VRAVSRATCARYRNSWWLHHCGGRMASDNAWQMQENWRRRILKEETSVVRRAKQGGAFPSLVVQSRPVMVNTIGTPTMLKPPRPRQTQFPSPGGSQTRGVQCSLEDAAGIPTRRADGAAAHSHRGGTSRAGAPTSKRSITGSVNGYAGSAAGYRPESQHHQQQQQWRSTAPSHSRPASESGSRMSKQSAWSYASSGRPPFPMLNIPRGSRPATPASQASYPTTPNFSHAGSANTEEVMHKLEELEAALRFEQQRRALAEAEMQRLRAQGSGWR